MIQRWGFGIICVLLGIFTGISSGVIDKFLTSKPKNLLHSSTNFDRKKSSPLGPVRQIHRHSFAGVSTGVIHKFLMIKLKKLLHSHTDYDWDL